MSVDAAVSEDGSTVTIKIKGRFDFDIHNEFRSAYENAQVNSSNAKYVVDLIDAEYMDSTALGMLLLLREHAGSDQDRVFLINCDTVTKQVLDIANFDKLFTVSGRE